MHTKQDSDIVPMSPQTLPVEQLAIDEASILEIDSTPLPYGEITATAESAQMVTASWPEESILDLPVSEAFPVPVLSDAKTAALVRGSSNSLSNFDRYNFGVQLLQIRPMWLLLSGFVFVSFIIFCSWFIKSEGQASSVSSNEISMNHSTNRSPSTEDSLPTTTTESDTDVVESDSGAVSTQKVSLVADPTETKNVAPVEPVATASPAPATEVKAETAVPSNQPASDADGKFTLQVGSYNDKAQADQRVASLKAAGFDARAVAVEIPKRGTWYRIQSGRFAARDEATRYGAQLRAKGAADSVLVAEVQAN
ncbi:MAG TPA: SPOR domain-containing protein [Pyrinomonadaceae bacterium]